MSFKRDDEEEPPPTTWVRIPSKGDAGAEGAASGRGELPVAPGAPGGPRPPGAAPPPGSGGYDPARPFAHVEREPTGTAARHRSFWARRKLAIFVLMLLAVLVGVGAVVLVGTTPVDP